MNVVGWLLDPNTTHGSSCTKCGAWGQRAKKLFHAGNKMHEHGYCQGARGTYFPSCILGSSSMPNPSSGGRCPTYIQRLLRH